MPLRFPAETDIPNTSGLLLGVAASCGADQPASRKCRHSPGKREPCGSSRPGAMATKRTSRRPLDRGESWRGLWWSEAVDTRAFRQGGVPVVV